MSNVKIEYLCDHIRFAEPVANWIFEEFVKGIKTDQTYETVLSKFTICHRDTLPIRLVAVMEDQCVETVSIVENDLACRNYTPWLAGLYVDKSYRNRKIGEQLIQSVKDISRGLGYRELFLRTEHASGYYKRLGWQYIETCEDDHDLQPDVFKITL